MESDGLRLGGVGSDGSDGMVAIGASSDGIDSNVVGVWSDGMDVSRMLVDVGGAPVGMPPESYKAPNEIPLKPCSCDSALLNSMRNSSKEMSLTVPVALVLCRYLPSTVSPNSG